MLERPHIRDVVLRVPSVKKYLFYTFALSLGMSQLNAAPAQAVPIQAPAHTEDAREGAPNPGLPESATWSDAPPKARPGQGTITRRSIDGPPPAQRQVTPLELQSGERADDV